MPSFPRWREFTGSDSTGNDDANLDQAHQRRAGAHPGRLLGRVAAGRTGVNWRPVAALPDLAQLCVLPGRATAAARAKLLTVLNGMARVKIVQSDPDRITAEFRSAVFGFVDDMEFRFGPPGAIQLRSASRSGYYDFGVNRERVETIRARFSAAP